MTMAESLTSSNIESPFLICPQKSIPTLEDNVCIKYIIKRLKELY